MAGSHASEFVGGRAGSLGEKIRELSDRERGHDSNIWFVVLTLVWTLLLLPRIVTTSPL